MADMNVLFIISDQHRRDYCGYAGHPIVKTPHLDQLASTGTWFSNAYCQSPLCGPSRSSLLTGTHCHTCRGLTHQQPFGILDIPTMGSVYRDAGYSTASLGKVHVQGEEKGTGRDLGFTERALRIYTYEWQDYVDAIGAENVDKYATYWSGSKTPRRSTYNAENKPVELPDELMYDHLVVDRCLAFLDKHKDERFFLWAGLEKPHPELFAPERFHKLYDPAQQELPSTWNHPTNDLPVTVTHRQRWDRSEDAIRGCMAAYCANVSYLDESIGRLLTGLEQLGLADNTIVVYTTDHGESLYEHGLQQKHCFFESAVSVPLVIHHPDIKANGRESGILTGLIDLFPTLLDLTGLQHPDTLEGQSLVNAMQGDDQELNDEVFSEFYSWGRCERMIRTHDWKYVWTEGDNAQLYDLNADPNETKNLALDPAHASRRDELDQRLKADWEKPENVLEICARNPYA